MEGYTKFKKCTVLIIMQFVFFSAYAQDTIIKSGSEWSYYDKGDLIIEDMSVIKPEQFDWQKGPTPMGFGQNDEATLINQVNDKDSIITWFVFQKTLRIENLEDHKTMLVRLVRDDGALVFVNGKEVIRTNLPEGNITSKTKATSLINGLFEYKFYEYFISPFYFNKGENLITVVLFQYSTRSSDCRFDMELLSYSDYTMLNQLIHNLNSERKLLENELALYTVEHMLQEKTNEIKYLNLKHNVNTNFYLLIIGVLFVGIAILIFFLIRSWKRRQDEHLKFKMLEKETDNKSKELINLSLSLLKVKQFISSLNEDLKRIHNKLDPPNQIEVEKIQNRIEFHKQFEEDWERLKMHFDTIHSGFFARLKSKYPELTQSELRHCTYIKLQMFTSEIAQMLNIDTKSVQTSRYRIKKKMQLPQEIDLKTFLEDF